MRTLWVLVLLSIILKTQPKSFIIDFQSNGRLSTEEWAEYLPGVPLMREFTSCFWEKLRYFATDYTAVWGYCKQKSSRDQSIKCTQFYHRGTPSTANRHVNVYGWIDGKIEITVRIKKYRHQTWNHFCWKYSSITGYNTFYYNGNIIGTVKVNDTPIIGSDDQLPNALILGQEQDAVKGRYELSQMLNGQISELHIWNYSIDSKTIMNIAQCKRFTKGNIVNWNRENYLINSAVVRDIEDSAIFCTRKTKYLFFPQPETLQNAKTLCAVHGGRIVTPRSAKENEEIYRILKQQGGKCLNMKSARQNERAIWLGFVRSGGKWFMSDDDRLIGVAPYHNWDIFTPVYPNLGCTFYQTDKYWSFRDKTSCGEMELCTICMLEETPVFSLKGPLCQRFTPFDWNFYISTNKSNQVDGFVGYKVSNISYQNNIWSSTMEGARISMANYSYPLGRKPWVWYNRRCGELGPEQRLLTLSKCEFGTEFTCRSGRCISINKRCNKIKDCNDGSDEVNCFMIRFPQNYDNVYQANANDNIKTKVWTQITIQNIDKIDSVGMIVGLTVKIKMRWKDSRLTFTNLDRKKKNQVPKEIADRLWIPLDNVVYANAVIGKTYQDRIRRVFIKPTSEPLLPSGYEIYEDMFYEGKENELEASQLFRVEYNCVFEVEKFPFDEHDCPFILKMMLIQNDSLILVQDDPSVIYKGPNIKGQYQIGDIRADDGLNGTETYFIVNIHMNRIYNDQLINTFIPTILLWLLSYSTFFIKLEDFNDRFIGTVTALLVMTSLLGSINMTLPRTSYFKYIDLWFLWYIANIFSIIICHIVLDYNRKDERDNKSHQKLENSTTKVFPIKLSIGKRKVKRHLPTLSGAFDEMFTNHLKPEKTVREKPDRFKDQMNKMAICFLPVINIIFIFMYSFLTTYGKHYDKH